MKIGPYHVDGYDASTKTLYEYYDCYFHGCPKCFPRRNETNRKNELSMTSLYERLLAREEWLKWKGCSLVTVWECNFRNLMKNNHKVERFVGNLDISNPIRGREAFLGGHTNALHLYYEIKEGEKIEYVDFCSLYPYINKTSQYPVGHLTVITKDFIVKPTDYFGIIKCDVLPPRRLYISVLPFRVNNKLMFPLCSKCAETMNQDKCHHSVNERQLTGVWCTPELEKPEEVGYRITKVYKVWHYDESATYNPETGEGALFTEYINMFLKIKQESSGYPEWCRAEEDRTMYIQRHRDRSKITPNPGLRAKPQLILGKAGTEIKLWTEHICRNVRQTVGNVDG
ncbi:uncharacterized protein LOC102802346 [Saccoglossus kowalevskii]|uniref:DNA-directed DNA polymerase n=1 Tax=Saccoglossus kowalevskii TaxID=10224 RepID=A0ABM0MAK4_SACKO|nr:PREDICTED: uncharacterized protein LOC102802346 [Saccoglossus kowalevskii]